MCGVWAPRPLGASLRCDELGAPRAAGERAPPSRRRAEARGVTAGGVTWWRGLDRTRPGGKSDEETHPRCVRLEELRVSPYARAHECNRGSNTGDARNRKGNLTPVPVSGAPRPWIRGSRVCGDSALSWAASSVISRSPAGVLLEVISRVLAFPAFQDRHCVFYRVIAPAPPCVRAGVSEDRPPAAVCPSLGRR